MEDIQSITEKILQSLVSAPLLWGAAFGVLLLLCCRLRLCFAVDSCMDSGTDGHIELRWRPVVWSRRSICLWSHRFDVAADNACADIIAKLRLTAQKIRLLRQCRPVGCFIRLPRVNVRVAVPGDPALAASLGGMLWMGLGCLVAAADSRTAGKTVSRCGVSLAGEGGWCFAASVEADVRPILLPLILWRLRPLWRSADYRHRTAHKISRCES